MQNNEELMKQHLNEIKYKKEQTFKEKYPEDYDYINKKYTFKKFMQYNNQCKICNDFCLGEFCQACQKSNEYKKFHFERVKQGQIKKYGSLENFHKYINTKGMETIKEKYGVENISQLEEIKRKKLKTTKEKYGVENISELEWVKEKKKKTNLERYGCENYLFSEDFKEKNKSANLKKFGVEHNKQSHFKNIENLNEEFVRENFIKDGKFLIHDFAEYFNIIAKTTWFYYKDNFNIIEPNKINNCKTQQFIFDLISVENKIFNDRHLGKELDIYLPDYNLAIEYDGLMYHSEGFNSFFKNTDKNYHLEKTELCLKNDIQLLHIFETEDLDLWLSMINSKLGLNNKIFARKCIIKELKSKETEDFLNKNHLQGFCQAKINVGLFYKDELVSLMTFSKPRFNKKYEYELIRFASKRNYTVIGGASKLWKYFVNKYNPKSVITYANRRFSNGDLYYKLGFNFIEKTQPNYFYFKHGKFKLYNRIKFQKHKLNDILEVYDENLSEAENMFNNKYRRIYDCGNLKFEWIKG